MRCWATPMLYVFETSDTCVLRVRKLLYKTVRKHTRQYRKIPKTYRPIPKIQKHTVQYRSQYHSNTTPTPLQYHKKIPHRKPKPLPYHTNTTKHAVFLMFVLWQLGDRCHQCYKFGVMTCVNTHVMRFDVAWGGVHGFLVW